MDREITTNTLVQKIAEGREFHRVMEDSRGHFMEITVSEYLTGLCRQRNLVPEQVIKKAQIDRTYGHQLFNGTRVPSRDKLLQLSIGMELDLKETQQLLKTAGKSILYAKIKRDAAVIYGITHHMDVMEVQGLLASIQAPLLGEA